MCEIIKEQVSENFSGCDVVVNVNENREIRLLVITDMQIIDSNQMRTPDRLSPEAAKATTPEFFDQRCGDHIRYLVKATNPDLILIPGDMVYGSFDDKGTTHLWLINLMDSFQIPWAPVFGNHDTETKMGVDWECEQLESSKYCLFKAGNVTGYGNYTVGITSCGQLIRMVHMLDSHLGLWQYADLCPDQLDMITKNSALAEKTYGKPIPSFVCFHVPTTDFETIEAKKGYKSKDIEKFEIGKNVPSKDDDFGLKCDLSNYYIKTDESFINTLKKCNTDAVITAHLHKNNYCISYDGIKWIYAVKTGFYDSHIHEKTGGTFITVQNEKFDVNHVFYPYY